MPAKCDLTVAPWLPLDPTVQKSHGIYRDSPFVRSVQVVDANDQPIDLSGGDFEAQIRKTRLTGTTAGEPLAQFAVDDTDADTGIFVLSLTREQTKALNLRAGTDAFWELQDQSTGLTWLTGKVRIYDDAGRPAA